MPNLLACVAVLTLSTYSRVRAQLATAMGARDIDTSWYAPTKGQINNLSTALHSNGAYGFIYNSSNTTDNEYGTYNWCNMPHVRPQEYTQASQDFDLQYVELIHRHHKRTPYASNAFPVESYPWNCDDEQLFLYGQPLHSKTAASAFRQGFVSSSNPFATRGWIGSCSFPQITAGGLQDSWQHGSDLYAVYHELLGFLPAKDENYKSVVRYRVTNNVITSQVAGMVISGMWSASDPFPLLTEAVGVDSLEPQYPCSRATSLYNSIKSASNPDWKTHMRLSAGLFRSLDYISGVPSDDEGFHASFDHYYDNLSARQCHGKPLPCKLIEGQNSTLCVSQDLANAVYRMGNWEYSQIYRDHPSSLLASALSLGIWIGEFTNHLRDAMAGRSRIQFFHNIAHDGSVSRLLSVLQIDEMVWPGMGSEVVFELFKRKSPPSQPHPTSHPEPGLGCSQGHRLQHLHWPTECAIQSRMSSTCACPLKKTKMEAAAAGWASQTPASSPSGFYIRTLFGGKVLKSSSPTLGDINMLPVEVLLDYLDALVGEQGSLIKSKCRI